MKILVFSDEENLLELIGIWLVDGGHTCTICSSPEEALEEIQNDKFEYVLADQMASQHVGPPSFLDSLRNIDPKIPIVIMSQNVRKSIVTKVSLVEWIAKPLNKDALLNLFEESRKKFHMSGVYNRDADRFLAKHFQAESIKAIETFLKADLSDSRPEEIAVNFDPGKDTLQGFKVLATFDSDVVAGQFSMKFDLPVAQFISKAILLQSSDDLRNPAQAEALTILVETIIHNVKYQVPDYKLRIYPTNIVTGTDHRQILWAPAYSVNFVFQILTIPDSPITMNLKLFEPPKK